MQVGPELDPQFVVDLVRDTSGAAEYEGTVWDAVRAGWADAEKCQDQAYLIPIAAPEGLERFELSTPTTTDRVMRQASRTS